MEFFHVSYRDISLFKSNPVKFGEPKTGKTAQDKQVPETAPFWVSRQVRVI